jgi:type IV secretory pathway VirD2 relaxase
VIQDDDLPIFRPQFGQKRGRGTRGGAAAVRTLRNAVLASAQLARTARRAVSRATRSRVAVTSPAASSRRVVVKARFVKMTASGQRAARLHLAYIVREGVEQDGSPGVLYGRDGVLRSEQFLDERPIEPHQFRLIISPEDGRELDLTEYIRRYMRRVEKDLGQRLQWAAVNHHDTDNPHAHVVIRGLDEDGHAVRLDRAYISNGLRWRAQEIATEELGPRPEVDRRRQLTREVTQDRFTSLDRELLRQAEDGEWGPPQGGSSARPDPLLLVGRVQHLEQLGLAERHSSTSWHLVAGWEQRLRELGERGDIIKQMHRAMGGDPGRYHIVNAGRPLPAQQDNAEVFGRVVQKGLADELKGSLYAVIETPNGSGYHVTLGPREAEALRQGDLVSVAAKPQGSTRPEDPLIVQFAQQNAGVYDSSVARPGATEPDAHERRLGELARIGLVRKQGDGRWAVPHNLVELLAERDRRTPQHRLVIRRYPLALGDQIHHRGPVWLDRAAAQPCALYGLGADVLRAIEKRNGNLRRLGIDPNERDRERKLHELERRAVGERFAASTKQHLVTDMPDRFRGNVRITERTPAGVSYAIISDGSRFVVTQASRELQSLDGKQVAVSRDARGQLQFTAPDRDRGRS